MSDSTLFESTFTITDVISDKYDRVSRISGTSTGDDSSSSTTLLLDINHDLFPVSTGEPLTVMLAESLSLDGKKDEGKGWRDLDRPGAETTLADMWEYVCYGRVYKFEDGGEGGTIKMYASFGGLLLHIQGPAQKLARVRMDNIYLLCKK